METLIAKDVEAVGRIDAIPSILKLCCQNTGLRFAAVARVTDTTWTACAVRDEINFGLGTGDDLDLKTTICDEIRCSGEGVIIDHVARDPRFRDHPTPRRFGFQSYISIPIRRPDGEFFGTLCALDPEPAKLANPATIRMFEGFAQLIGLQLDAQDRLTESEAALADEARVGHFREQFIAILAHDLRNPLASIDAGISLLSRSDLPPRETSILGRMRESCSRMNGLITDVLDFARGHLGSGFPINPTRDHDLKSALEQVVEELCIVHPERKVHCMMDLASSVECDVPRVTQLLSNLLGNALSHGDPVQPVHVDARSDGETFSIEVTNRGDPIPEEKLATIFEPFTDHSDERSPAGLGLGLFIAREIAVAHHGRIEVSSTTGETRFKVTMPCSVNRPAIPLAL